MRQLTQENSATLRAGMPLAIEAGAGRILQLNRAAGSVFAADPRVVEVRPASPTSLFLFGVAPGRTTIAAIDGQGAPVAQYEVTVRPSGFGAGEAQSTISRLLPGNRIRAEQRGNGIALHGEVATAAEADQAANIARGYLAEGQQLDNRLSVLGQVQVNLRVRIAEVSREVTRQLGVDWQAVGRVRQFRAQPADAERAVRRDQPLQHASPAGWSDGKSDINGIIDALAQDQLITVLAEPNLTAMSGETASFLVGRRIPHPGGAARTTSSPSVQAVRRQPGLRADGDVARAGISLKVRPGGQRPDRAGRGQPAAPATPRSRSRR